jgi:hypothetical protein
MWPFIPLPPAFCRPEKDAVFLSPLCMCCVTCSQAWYRSGSRTGSGRGMPLGAASLGATGTSAGCGGGSQVVTFVTGL